eukprot:3325543-Rhodomonas_salina.1
MAGDRVPRDLLLGGHVRGPPRCSPLSAYKQPGIGTAIPQRHVAKTTAFLVQRVLKRRRIALNQAPRSRTTASSRRPSPSSSPSTRSRDPPKSKE